MLPPAKAGKDFRKKMNQYLISREQLEGKHALIREQPKRRRSLENKQYLESYLNNQDPLLFSLSRTRKKIRWIDAGTAYIPYVCNENPNSKLG